MARLEWRPLLVGALRTRVSGRVCVLGAPTADVPLQQPAPFNCPHIKRASTMDRTVSIQRIHSCCCDKCRETWRQLLDARQQQRAAAC